MWKFCGQQKDCADDYQIKASPFFSFSSKVPNNSNRLRSPFPLINDCILPHSTFLTTPYNIDSMASIVFEFNWNGNNGWNRKCWWIGWMESEEILSHHNIASDVVVVLIQSCRLRFVGDFWIWISIFSLFGYFSLCFVLSELQVSANIAMPTLTIKQSMNVYYNLNNVHRRSKATTIIELCFVSLFNILHSLFLLVTINRFIEYCTQKILYSF